MHVLPSVSCKFIFLSWLSMVLPYFSIEGASSRSKNTHCHTNVLNMAKAFGKYHNGKYSILHYKSKQDSSWKNQWYSIMKEKIAIGYFSANEISSKNTWKSVPVTNGITTHLYVNHDLKPLKHMIEANWPITTGPRSATQMRRNVGSSFWLIQMPHNATKDLMINALNDTEISYNSNTFCFSFIGNGIIEIYDSYKITHSAPPILKRFGIWSVENSLKVIDRNICSRRSSLDGHHIRVTSAYSPPFVSVVEDNCTSNVCFKGDLPDTWHSLSQRMNFTYTVRRAYQWGNLVNGTWNGMIGQVNMADNDVAVADLTVTKDRSTVVAFLPSLKQVNLESFMKTPEDSLYLDVYLMPFTFQVWLVVLLWIVSVPVLLGIITLHGDQQDSNRFTISHCFWFVAQSFMMRGDTILPNSNSNRIAFVIALVGGIVMYYNWEADLISYLTIKRIKLPFSNLQELAENSKYRVIVPQGTYLVDYFKYSKEPVRKRIWKEKIEPYVEQLPLFDDYLDALLNDQFVVAFSENGLKRNQAYFDCKIIPGGIVLATSSWAWATRKQYPFYEAFSYHIKKMKEIGLVQRNSKKYQLNNPVCKDYNGKPITNNQSMFIFEILLLGFLGSLLWLILEKTLPQEQMNSITTFGDRKFKQIFVCNKRKSTPLGNKMATPSFQIEQCN